MYSNYQQLVSPSGKLLLNCWKVSKQTEHHNRRASACSPDFSHQKEQSSNKHHRHHKDIGSLAPATSDLRVFLHGIPSLSRRPPYFHHAVLAADIRYPVSIAIQLPEFWSPPQTAPGRIHSSQCWNSHDVVLIWSITSGVADCTFTIGGGHGAYGLTAENHHGRSTPSSFWWTTSPSAYAWSLQPSSAKSLSGGTTAWRGNQPTAAARVKLLWRKGTIHQHLQEGNLIKISQPKEHSRSISTPNNPFRSPQNPRESCRKQLLGRYLVGSAVAQTSQTPKLENLKCQI